MFELRRNFLKCKNVLNYIEQGEKKQINIGYGIDEKYIRPMIASIASFVYNNRNFNLQVHIVSGVLKEKDVNLLRKFAIDMKISMIYYEIDDKLVSKFSITKYWSIAMYYRYFLPYIVSDDVEYIFYFDADIICNKSCEELFLYKINKVIGAATDLDKTRKKQEKRLLLKGKYFNSGVLIINRSEWIKKDVLSELIKILNCSYKLKYPDQDALNIIFDNDYCILSNKFNLLDMIDDKLENASLLHFANHPKPWTREWRLNPAYDTSARDVYDFYEKKTPMRNVKKIKSGNVYMLIKWFIKKNLKLLLENFMLLY